METNGLKKLWTECFGNEDGWVDAFLQTAFCPGQVRTLDRQGAPAAALSWMEVTCEGQKMAYLYAIATHPDHRRQGLCRELMARTHGELAERGYAGTILVPADARLRQMYAEMGYGNFGGLREISAKATDPIPLRALSAEEYAALRREFLPAGGVVQESGAIAYLAQSARFYRGAEFLLAAALEEDRLFGVELLGNPDSAGGILAALGYEKGVFRMPGEKPFAMFRPLRRDARTPGYFGLAFE